jgi:hypothetical protein
MSKENELMEESMDQPSPEIEMMEEGEEVFEEVDVLVEESTRHNQIRDIEISQLNYGYIVKIGCHKFAIEKPKTLVDKLLEYLNNPSETEDKWFKGELLK